MNNNAVFLIHLWELASPLLQKLYCSALLCVFDFLALGCGRVQYGKFSPSLLGTSVMFLKLVIFF